MYIKLINVQSFLSAEYDIDEGNGLIQIVGGNSNGKSILIRAVSFVANCKIKDKHERDIIINDNYSYALIIMQRNNMQLLVNIDRERENCFYELKRGNGDTIKRYIREGGLEELADEFGWISYPGNICLQISETYGIMPFVNNSLSGDYQIIDSIITDKVANDFVNNYKDITYPKFKEYVKLINSQITNENNILSSLVFYDLTTLEELEYKLSYYSSILNYLVTYEPCKLPITKYLKFSGLFEYKPAKLPIVRFCKPLENLRSLKVDLYNYHTAYNGVCPTCGISYKDNLHLH